MLQEAERGFQGEEQEFEGGKQEIEKWVEKGMYSQVVSKKDVYESMVQKMHTESGKMRKVVEEGQKRISKIVNVKCDTN